uniref:tRNA(Ile)-lysidine synthase n=1 Tax=candidate division WOR-3 bacterium TaxID=2052148 RepID=A0A7C4U9D3_UNCW3
MIERIKRFIDENRLLNKNERYLLSFSGGPDSVFLSFILDKIGYEFELFYLNHLLREDADKEEKFVKEFAEKLKRKIFVERFDVKRFCEENKLGIEEGARIIRREKLYEKIIQFNYNYALLAHTLDDLIENFFIRIFRGSGFGIPGMKMKEDWIIRPILNIRKNEIVSFLNNEKIEYYIDPSNSDRSFLRNRIRMELIPLIEDISPTGLNGIIKTIDNIESMKSSFYKMVKDIKIRRFLNHIEFDSGKYLSLPESLRFLFMRNALSIFSGELELKKEHIKKSEGRFELKNFIVEINKNFGIIHKKVQLEEKRLDIDKSLIFGDFYIECKKVDDLIYKKNEFEDVEYFDLNDLFPPFFIRKREEGDKMVRFRKNRERKIKDFFIDKKIPVILRDFWPLVCDRNGILFIPFVARCERGKIKKETKDILMFKCRRILNGWT